MEESSAPDEVLNFNVLLFAGQLRKLVSHTDRYVRNLESGETYLWSEDFPDRWIDEWGDIGLERDRFLLEADKRCGVIGVNLFWSSSTVFLDQLRDVQGTCTPIRVLVHPALPGSHQPGSSNH
jgi:hypothetical protein